MTEARRASRRNVGLLAVCQALFWGALMIGITMAGLVGQMLANNPALATVPVGIMAVTVVVVTRPASLLMQRWGRRAGFLIGAAAGMVGGGVCVAGIFAQDFVTFCAGNAILGVYQAIGQYYRLAAADSVPENRRGRAVSMVMAGAVVAAVLAPVVTVWSQNLFAPVVFAGSFLMVSVLSLAASAVMVFLDEPTAAAVAKGGGRPLWDIVRRPAFVVAIVNAGVANGVMILVMLAAPLAMVANSHRVGDAAVVIQWHVLGMFVPSFFSGRLIDRFGAAAVSLAGVGLLASGALVAASGTAVVTFGTALMLVGAGWNFMYVAGTTMITAAHRPEERGSVQGAAEMLIAIIAALAAVVSGGLLAGFGWTVVNLSALAILAPAAGLTIWFGQAQRRGSALV